MMKAMLFPLLLVCSLGLSAQQKADTLECTFDAGKLHKDGYEIQGAIFDLPLSVAQKCDHQKIRVIAYGNTLAAKKAYAMEHINTGEVMQGRYEAVPVMNDSGKLEMKMMPVPGGNSYAAYTIFLWLEKKKRWEQVYSNI